MEFKEYQDKAMSTAIFTDKGNVTFEANVSIDETGLNYSVNLDFVYPALGLLGEAGEIANKLKKIIRDKEGSVTLEDRLALKKELGDVLWYLAVLAKTLKLNLDDIAIANLNKLTERKERNTLKGDGDDR